MPCQGFNTYILPPDFDLSILAKHVEEILHCRPGSSLPELSSLVPKGSKHGNVALTSLEIGDRTEDLHYDLSEESSVLQALRHAINAVRTSDRTNPGEGELVDASGYPGHDYIESWNPDFDPAGYGPPGGPYKPLRKPGGGDRSSKPRVAREKERDELPNGRDFGCPYGRAGLPFHQRCFTTHVGSLRNVRYADTVFRSDMRSFIADIICCHSLDTTSNESISRSLIMTEYDEMRLRGQIRQPGTGYSMFAFLTGLAILRSPQLVSDLSPLNRK